MAIYSTKKVKKGAQFLLTITVNGSSGPIRFLVNEDDTVGKVIDKAVKKYANEGRLMDVLGSDLNKLGLRCVNSSYDALSPWDTIGQAGCRNFILYKEEKEDDSKSTKEDLERKGSGNWKKLVIRSLGFKVTSR